MDVWRVTFAALGLPGTRSAPGRNLFYLERDAAQPMHPVMGIAALGNAVMQLTPRDDVLGWTTTGLQRILDRGEATEQQILDALRHRLLEDLKQIYTADLPVGPDPELYVTDEILDRLQRIEEQSVELRLAGCGNSALQNAIGSIH